ncbi:unnamed protein product [Ixodes persulcatus]
MHWKQSPRHWSIYGSQIPELLRPQLQKTSFLQRTIKQYARRWHTHSRTAKTAVIVPNKIVDYCECIERTLGQFESLKMFFHNINARILRDTYSDVRNYVYLIFLAAVLHNV